MPWGPLAEGLSLGKYRLLRRMGEGGMALVFEAEHMRLGQRVAIKVLREDHEQSPLLVERFEREGRAIGKLKSPHVVRVLDVDSTPGGAPYLVMELLEGGDLAAELTRRGPLPVAEAVGYVLQACRGLAEAHAQGIIHRDIKPANLFLANEGGARVLKVLDFGIARDVPGPDARLTQTETVMGTPLYMAPEQFRGARDVDARADVWALGATLYELLSGRPPFLGTAATIGVAILTDPAPPLDAARTDVPRALAVIVARALEKDRERRYASAEALGNALAGFSSDAGIAPRSSGPFPSHGTVIGNAQTQSAVSAQTGAAARPGSRRALYRRLALLAAALAGVLAFAAFVRVTRSSGPSPAGATEERAREPSAASSVAPPEVRRAVVESPPVLAASASASTLASARGVPVSAPAARTPKPAPRPSASAAPAPSAPPLFFPGQ